MVFGGGRILLLCSSLDIARHFAWYNMVLSYTQIPHDMGLVISISENDIHSFLFSKYLFKYFNLYLGSKKRASKPH